MPKRLLTPIPYKEPPERKKKCCDVEVIVQPKIKPKIRKRRRKARKSKVKVQPRKVQKQKQKKRRSLLRKSAYGMYVLNCRRKYRHIKPPKLRCKAYRKITQIHVQPIYYFRPLPGDFDGTFYRYDDGVWIPDDGKPGLAFAGLRPERRTLLGSSYPYCLFARVKSQMTFTLLYQEYVCSFAEHPNHKAWQSGLQFLHSKYKVANGKNVLLGNKYVDCLEVQSSPISTILEANKEIFYDCLKARAVS